MRTSIKLLSCLIAFNVAMAAPSAKAARGIFPTKQFASRVPRGPFTTAARLQYYGGPVLSHVKVQVVFWGPNVDAQVKSEIGDFYSNAVNSNYMDWLQEYNTKTPTTNGGKGTDQDVGRGSMAGSYTITPKNTGTTLDKKEVEAELEFQIGQSKIPAPDANTLYMIHFPAGITLTTGGIASCQAWCGDHEGFASAKYGSIAYAMLPDIGGACSSGCGFAGTSFDSMTVIASHELIESVTDPLCPDIGANPASPAAWVAPDQNEIGDLCVSSSATLQAPNRTYAIQGEWDNSTNGCKGGAFSSP